MSEAISDLTRRNITRYQPLIEIINSFQIPTNVHEINVSKLVQKKGGNGKGKIEVIYPYLHRIKIAGKLYQQLPTQLENQNGFIGYVLSINLQKPFIL